MNEIVGPAAGVQGLNCVIQAETKTRSTRITALRALIVILLLTTHFSLLISSAYLKSPTSDEPFHIARGVSALFSGDFRLNVAHPPLINLICAMPLLALDDLNIPFNDTSWRNPKADLSYRKVRFAKLMLWRLNPDPQRIILLARIPVMILSVILGIMVFTWARRLYGANAGLLSLFLYCFSPSILAHARLITTDTGVTLLVFVAVFTLKNYMRRPTWLALLLAALAFSLAQLSKFTAILLYPVFLILLFLAVPLPIWQKARSFFRLSKTDSGVLGGLWAFIFIAAAAAILIWAGYGFETRSQHKFENLSLEKDSPTLTWKIKKAGIKSMASIPIPPRTYYYGLARTLTNTEEHYHPLYFMGELSNRGWWYYYPVLFLIKVPLALIILLALRALTLKLQATREKGDGMFLLIPPLLIFAFFVLFNRMNIGLRHILPVFPFIHVWLGGLATLRFRRRVIYNGALGLLLVWYAASAVSVHPDYLVYFNEAAGGLEGGLKYSVLGEDWGQDIAGLGRYMEENNISSIHYTPYGNTDPRAYGVNYSRIQCNEPKPGIFALHRSEQVRPLSRRPADCYTWLDMFEPVETIGHTIRIYKITESDLTGQADSQRARGQEPRPPSQQ